MGKKRSRSTYISKGERRNISNDTVKSVRRETGALERECNKIKAWRNGKNPWITVPGDSTKERFKKVRAITLWGDPRKARGIYTRESEVG